MDYSSIVEKLNRDVDGLTFSVDPNTGSFDMEDDREIWSFTYLEDMLIHLMDHGYIPSDHYWQFASSIVLL